MMSYAEIERMPASAFLDASGFVTAWDGPHNQEYRKQQYETGRNYGERATMVSSNYNGVWGARLKDGSHVSSYEGIGYHAGTSDLLQGFLDSGALITVYRRGQKPVTFYPESILEPDYYLL